MASKRSTPGAKRKHITIVSISLTPAEKDKFDAITDQRGMTIKSLLGRLIDWFAERDTTEQAMILGQVEARDVKKLAEMVGKRA